MFYKTTSIGGTAVAQINNKEGAYKWLIDQGVPVGRISDMWNFYCCNLRILPTGANVRYVSNSILHGFSIGSDTNDGLTKQTPYLTIDHALASVPKGGDVVLNTGDFILATYHFANKDLSLWAHTVGDSRVITQNSARVIAISGAFGWEYITYDGIVLDANSLAASVITGSTPTGAIKTATFRHCSLNNPIGKYVDLNIVSGMNFTMINCTGRSSLPMQEAILFESLTSGVIDIDGFDYDYQQESAYTEAIKISALAPGVTASVKNTNVNFRVDASVANGRIRRGILIEGIDNAAVLNNTMTMKHDRVPPTVQFEGISVRATATGVTAHNARIQNNNVTIDNTKGICITSNYDGSNPATNNLANDPIVTDNNCTFLNTVSGHGILIGNNQGGDIERNRVTGCFNSIISKGQKGNTQRTRFKHNKVFSVSGTGEALRVKGSDNIDYENNKHRMDDGFRGNSLYVTDNDDSTPSSGCTFVRNISYSSGSIANRMVNTTLNAAVFEGNNYFTVGPLPANVFGENLVYYQNVTEWNEKPNTTNETEDDIPVCIDANCTNKLRY